jgi:hypothetical protein
LPHRQAGGFHLDPAQRGITAADLRSEFHRLAAQVALGPNDTLLTRFITDQEALPAKTAVFLLTTPVDPLCAERPLQFVVALRIHQIFVHRTLGQVRDRAISTVVHRKMAIARCWQGIDRKFCWRLGDHVAAAIL